MRPIQVCKDGVLRFKANALVRAILDENQKRGGFGLNDLAIQADDFPQADWEEFYQLIGYSIAGYHELTNVSDASALEASAAAKLIMADAGGCRDKGCPYHSGVAMEEPGERQDLDA